MKTFQEFLNESIKDFISGETKTGEEFQIALNRSDKLKALGNLIARQAKSGKIPAGLTVSEGNTHLDFSIKKEQNTVYIFNDKDVHVNLWFGHGNMFIINVKRIG